jgi:hypothetical protein
MSYHRQLFTAAQLTPGQTYRVITTFEDYDGIIHPVGETWRFVEKNFLPYEDGLSLLVEKDGENIWFRFQWRAETQAQLIDNFSDFVKDLEDISAG